MYIFSLRIVIITIVKNTINKNTLSQIPLPLYFHIDCNSPIPELLTIDNYAQQIAETGKKNKISGHKVKKKRCVSPASSLLIQFHSTHVYRSHGM